MKTTGLKFVLMFSILSLVGAITQASFPTNYFVGDDTMIVDDRKDKNVSPKSEDESAGFYNQIQNTLPCPDFLREENRDVRTRLLLSVSDEGIVKVEKVVTDDPRIEQYIRSTLDGAGLKLESHQCGRLYNFSVHFRII